MQPGCPHLFKVIFLSPSKCFFCHYMVSLCSHHYNNRIHKTKCRNKEISYWKLMKHRRIVQAVQMRKSFEPV
jgi:hypothetical protein